VGWNTSPLSMMILGWLTRSLLTTHHPAREPVKRRSLPGFSNSSPSDTYRLIGALQAQFFSFVPKYFVKAREIKAPVTKVAAQLRQSTTWDLTVPVCPLEHTQRPVKHRLSGIIARP
jgi:hypothetical protein